MNKNKYRGQREGDEWVYGSLVVDGFHSFIIGGSYFYPATENRESVGFFEFSEVFPSTVGQFTGLKDKNGVEIYDGDILGGMLGGVVVWFNEESRFAIDLAGDLHEVSLQELDRDELIVIGNIYDNPCLLE